LAEVIIFFHSSRWGWQGQGKLFSSSRGVDAGRHVLALGLPHTLPHPGGV